MRTGRWVALLALPLVLGACRGDEPREAMDAGDAAAPGQQMAQLEPADTIVVYKSPTCGCCSNWVDHVRENGFAVVTHDTNDLTPIKQQLGVPAGQISCHTATVGGYTIEGHVPADLIRKMLNEKASIRGLAVPGMPMGSPGMEGIMKEKYDVLSFDENGRTAVYAKR